MPFQVSPGVLTREIDLTTIVPAVSTTEGAIAGVFRWGPIEQRVLIDSEVQLANRFGKPTNLNAEQWFTAASFLGYGNRLIVSRAANTTGITPTATCTITAGNSTVIISSGNVASLGLETGLYVISSSASGMRAGAKIASLVNSTAFTISSAADALANSVADSLQFISNTAFSAVANTGPVANLEYAIVKNEDHFTTKDGTFDTDVKFVARFPGELGNSLRVSVCGNSSGFNSTINLASFGANISFTVESNSNTATVLVAADAAGNATANSTAFKALLNTTDLIEVGNTLLGVQYLKITEVGSDTLSGANATFTLSFEDEFKLAEDVTFDSEGTGNTLNRYWEFFNAVDTAPGQSDYVLNFGNSAINSDEMHIVITDDGGKFTGIPGTILEAYKAVSRATDAKTLEGAANYWKEVINDASQYVYAVNDLSGAASASSENLVNSTLDVQVMRFNLGRDGADEATLPLGVLTRAYDQFASAEDVDISLVLQGRARSFQLANYLIDNICEARLDCMAFISPQKADVVNNIGNEADSIVSFRNNLRSTSYAVLDSGYKYMYDRYNDVYRWIPLNGDIAGLCVRTDQTNDPWWSPAGFNRGQIKNIVKLAYNPRKADRDTLYKEGINPVVTFPGEGTILYGDKTLLRKSSAFDRINVRRLFIVLEKSIAKASKYTLFEFNDAFTRSQFKNLVIPYLRDVQGRRGVQDFLVVCDESNNTAEVIDRNEFVGDIYIKPARSINFIRLNFIAVRSGVSFNEVIGNY